MEPKNYRNMRIKKKDFRRHRLLRNSSTNVVLNFTFQIIKNIIYFTII